jgi:hypothetical protein
VSRKESQKDNLLDESRRTERPDRPDHETSLGQMVIELNNGSFGGESVMALGQAMSPVFAPRKYSKPGKFAVSKENSNSRYAGRGESPIEVVHQA